MYDVITMVLSFTLLWLRGPFFCYLSCAGQALSYLRPFACCFLSSWGSACLSLWKAEQGLLKNVPTLIPSTGEPVTHYIACVLYLVASVVSEALRPVDCSPPGSSVYGILQARILEWVVMPLSRGSS